MKPESTIWDRLSKVVVFLLCVAGIAAVVIWYLPLVQQNERMRKVILDQEKQIQHEEETARATKNASDALRNDPKTVERLAREKLGYAKPGETVIRFEGGTTNASIPAP
ncbi:MAG: septum formation initiator family protein [Verrucomicrobia bacterium]|nr:septum formation initiator family protein [Verrucomicrobiota bacterium]